MHYYLYYYSNKLLIFLLPHYAHASKAQVISNLAVTASNPINKQIPNKSNMISINSGQTMNQNNPDSTNDSSITVEMEEINPEFTPNI